MTDSSQPTSHPTQNSTLTSALAVFLTDGALYVAAALIMAVVFSGLIGVFALILVVAVWVVNRRGLRDVPFAFGPVGWVMLALLFWMAFSFAWSVEPNLSLDRIIRFAIVTLLAFPAILLVARAQTGSIPHGAVVLVIAAMAGIMVFEAASGGMLQRLLPGGGGVQVLFTVMVILMWPVVMILAVHYGKREAALWVLVCVGAIAFGGAVELRVAIGFSTALFLIAMVSKWAVRLLLWVMIVVGSIMPAIALTFAGDQLLTWADALRDVAPEFPIQIEFWRLAVEKWAGSPIYGWGVGTAITLPGWSVLQDVRGGFGNSFIHLLVGVGGIGFLLALILLLLIVHRVVDGDNTNWRLSAISGLVGGFLALPVPGAGVWQSWWIGALVISSIAIVGCRKPETASAALGSIFDGLDDDDDEDEEQEDDGLYHFDNGDDDDEYYDIDDESDEWDSDDADDADDADDPDDEDRGDDDDADVDPLQRR